MIDSRDVLKAGGRVAILTSVGGVDVGRVLAGGIHPVVARRTVASHAGVIELGVIPRVGVVAVIAGIGAGDVIRGFAFSGGAVVAGCTGAEHGVVIDARYVLKA